MTCSQYQRHFRQPEVVAQVEPGSGCLSGNRIRRNRRRDFRNLGPITRVGAKWRRRLLLHFRAGGFAQGRDGINAADGAGRRKGVGRELRQLRRPYIRGDDALAPGSRTLYTCTRASMADLPASVCSPPNEHPIRVRAGHAQRYPPRPGIPDWRGPGS